MPRVLHVIESLGLGGAERLLALTVRELKRTSYTNVVAHLLDEPRDWRASIEDDGIAVESLMLPTPHAIPAAVAGVRRLVRRWRVDLIHSHLYYPNLAAQLAGWRERVPVVSSLHNLELEPEIGRDNPKMSANKRRLMRAASRLAIRLGRPTLVAVSAAVRDSALRTLGADPARVVTIHNGVDLDAATVGPDRAAAREAWGIDASTLVLVIVGRLVSLKGHRYLFQALSGLRTRHPGTTLLVVGDGPFLEPFRTQVRDLGLAGAVRFLGAAPGLAERAVAAADVLVAPSLSEGFGLAVLEAMAMRRPCVVSRTGGLPEIVEDGGSGFLVAPGDVPALTAALTRLADDAALRERLGRRGRAIVEERFDVRETARRLAALYDGVLARGGRRTG